MYTSATKPSLSSPGLTAPQTGNGVMPPLHVELERVAETIASRSALPLPQLRFVNARSVPTEELVDAVALVENPLPRETIAWLAHGARAVLDTESPRTVLVPAVAALVRDRSGAEVGVDDLQSRAPAMRRLLADARRVAGSNASVLITGATGVGKEHLARALHAAGPRAERPFLVVNCGALPENLLESQLFGHERGAFTGATTSKGGLVEAASGGTLFLDEVGDIPLPMQVKLLRLLETGTYRRVGSTELRHTDIRIVSATHRDIETMVQDGRFREDLFYRLCTFPIPLPPLRERTGDVALLATALLERVAAPRRLEMTPPALRLLEGQPFPGNVRELRNLLERAALLCDGDRIEAEHVSEAIATGRRLRRPVAPAGQEPPVSDLRGLERQALREALARHRGSRASLAAQLGMSERTLYRKLKQFGLDAPTA